ncbi:MAG: hypothetical protein DLM61_26650 [Pseudonocardiales bacterium]|nr:MAG: hypothetical protein DLM61_26650 [Pseudonocardiales bacterium]
MAFDPATDDPELLLTVIQLLRLGALTASNRADRGGIHSADDDLRHVLSAYPDELAALDPSSQFSPSSPHPIDPSVT